MTVTYSALVVINETFGDISINSLKKHFPGRTCIWKEIEFEIIHCHHFKPKKISYDFIVLYVDYVGCKPFPYIKELYTLRFRDIIFIPLESKTVVDYSNHVIYTNLMKTDYYKNMKVFSFQDFPSKYHKIRNVQFPFNVINDHNDVDFDTLKKGNIQKDKLVSIICSDFTYARDHKQRIEFTKQVKQHFGDRIDFYGRGFNTFDDKYKTIAPYKYHIAMENGREKDYWTEKFADSVLSEAYTFYYGCPNLHDYFPRDIYTEIDIYDFKKSIKIIEEGMKDNLYEKSLEEIRKARNLILDKYNVINIWYECCMDPMISKEFNRASTEELKTIFKTI